MWATFGSRPDLGHANSRESDVKRFTSSSDLGMNQEGLPVLERMENVRYWIAFIMREL